MADRTTVLITGGTSAIGYETVKALLHSHRSYHVFLAGRSLERANAAVKSAVAEVADSHSIVEAIPIDIENDESIEAAYQAFSSSQSHLDCLINNAGRQPSRKV